MKISDINRELYRDDIARIEEEIIIFRNMLRRKIIDNDGVYFDAYKDEIRIKSSYYYYPDKIDIGYEAKLRSVSEVNILIDNIVKKLREKYCVDFKYKKIRIFPKIDIDYMFDLAPATMVIAIIIAFAGGLIYEYSKYDTLGIIIFQISILILLIYVIGLPLYMLIYNIYKRWLS